MAYTKFDVFLTIMKCGSLTKAAETLSYSQSAISQTVRSLENTLGITLLIRNRNALSLTSEGEQIFPYIKDICNAHSALNEKVNSIKGICSGEIRIGAYHLVASHILPRMIRNFLEIHPKIKFQIKEGDYTEIRDWINDGTVDFGFLSIHDIKDIECIPYAEDPMYVVFPSDAAESKKNLFDLRHLHKYPYIYLDAGKINDCTQIFKGNNITPDIVYTVREDDTVLSMIENRLGISILPALAKVKRNYDVTFIPTFPSYSRILGIAIKNQGDASHATKTFIQYIKQIRETS